MPSVIISEHKTNEGTTLSHLFAYLDPGTGSIVIQALIGITAGVALFGRKTIGLLVTKVRSFFNKSDAKKK